MISGWKSQCSSPPSRTLVVGISECAVSADPRSVIITYALGSCIAVSVYDANASVGGLLHIILPESHLNPEKAQANPFMFADTGIPKLLESVCGKGADRRRLVVHLAGGAQVMDRAGIFNIGKRNHLAAKKMLWKAGLMIAGEAVGGEVSRTVRLDMASGGFFIREGGQAEWQMPAHDSGLRRKGGL